PKRKFSEDALRRMREAQQRRWAKARRESESPAPAKPAAPKKKGKLSAAGRAAIVVAQKKRWAAKKAGMQSVAAKKAGRSKQALTNLQHRQEEVEKTGPKKTAPAPAQVSGE